MGRSSENRKSIATTNAFKIAFCESGRKPKRIWVNEGSECY